MVGELGKVLPEITIPVRKYTITYDALGGSSERVKDVVAYDFLGYFDSNGKQYYDKNGVGCLEWDKEVTSATLYAHWKANSVSLPNATWEHFKLNGWSDGTNVYEPEDNYTPIKSITLTAKWNAGITIYDIDIFTYDGNGNGVLSSYIVYAPVGTKVTTTQTVPVEKIYSGYNYHSSSICDTTYNAADNVIYRFYDPKLSVSANVINTSGNPYFMKNEIGMLDMTVTGYVEKIYIEFPDEFLGSKWTNTVTGSVVDLTEDTTVTLNIQNQVLSGDTSYAFKMPDTEFEDNTMTINIVASRGTPCEAFLIYATDTSIKTECKLDVEVITSLENIMKYFRSAIRSYRNGRYTN